MQNFTLQIRVRFKDGILDPQAEAIESALKKLNFKSIQKVECDKLFQIQLLAEDESQALNLGRQMAHQLLANVVMENFEVEVVRSA